MEKTFHLGFLMHISHYDPAWCDIKEKEEKFDLQTALCVVRAMSRQGMDLLVVDCEDGVEYKSHPELKRPYSVPMSDLRELAGFANSCNIDIVPKLNFAKSDRKRHDLWLEPNASRKNWLEDIEEYFKIADDIISELIQVCKPRQYFHIGMDEDHSRSSEQYADAIIRLRTIVSRHGLRTVIWNDSCENNKNSMAQVHAEKSIAAEKMLPKDIVHVLWQYSRVHPECVKRLTAEGFDVWAAPGHDKKHIMQWREALLENHGSGILMTNWIKCAAINKNSLIDVINLLGKSDI